MTRPDFDRWTWRAGTALANLVARLGVGPLAQLTTTGRITGRAHTVPVVPIDHAGRRWLVAPYGAVAWVHNARADPNVVLRHGRHRERLTAREVADDDAAAVLQRYVQVATRARSSFAASPDAPLAAFAAEAGRHPVFEVRKAA